MHIKFAYCFLKYCHQRITALQAEYEISRERDENLFYTENCDGVCPVHFHKKLEILYVTDGVKTIYAGSSDTELSADNMFVADSYTMHGYYASEGGKQIVAVIPNSNLGAYFADFGDKTLAENVIRDEEFCKKVLPLLKSLNNKKVNSLLYQANVDMLLGLIVEKVGLKPKTAGYSLNLIDDILHYIDEHYTDEITLDVLSERFGYSKYYFSRLFNAGLGTSISDYVALIRANKTLAILRNDPETKVTDAAFACGFNSLASFYRTLKKNYTYKKIEDLIK